MLSACNVLYMLHHVSMPARRQCDMTSRMMSRKQQPCCTINNCSGSNHHVKGLLIIFLHVIVCIDRQMSTEAIYGV